MAALPLAFATAGAAQPAMALPQASAQVSVAPVVNAGGLCATVQGAATTADTPVVLEECTGADSQQWTAGDDGTLRSLDQCLETAPTETANDSGVRVNPCTRTLPHQRWTARDNGQLVGATSGRCLKANGAAGTQLVVFDCDTTDALRWQAPPSPPRADIGQAWNLADPTMCVSATTADASVNQAPCDSYYRTRWVAEANGTMRSALGHCMELPADQTASGTLVRLNKRCSAQAHQLWTAQPDGQLRHEASGHCLSTDGTATQLVVATCTAAPGQVWSLPVPAVVATTAYSSNDAV